VSKFIVHNSNDVVQRLHEQGAIPDPRYVRRVVIDLQAGSIGRMYVELFADDEKLSASLADMKIEVDE
jgi:hypothetical protein